MPLLRRPAWESPAREPALYHVVVPAAGASLEIATPSDGCRISADAVTALFIGPLALGALMSRAGETDALSDAASAGGASLVISLTMPMINAWSWLLAGTLLNQSRVRSKVLRQTIVLSASTLLHAQRLRLRVAECARPGTSPFISIRGDCDEAAPFLDELFSDFIEIDPAALFRRSAGRRRTLVDRARSALARCPDSSHRLTGLAESLGVSAFHLAHVFRAETALSVHQYLLRLRMARALHRLSCSDIDLSRLALEIGFSSHSHFSATFHKQFGATPAQVRNSFARHRVAGLGRQSTSR